MQRVPCRSTVYEVEREILDTDCVAYHCKGSSQIDWVSEGLGATYSIRQPGAFTLNYEHEPESKYKSLVYPADLGDCAGLGSDAGDGAGF